MFKKFYPDFKFGSIKEIDGRFFAENNIRYAILDIDNTLVSYTLPVADKTARDFLAMLENEGIKYAFVSNNHKERVEKFCSEFDAEYVYDAAKPFLCGIRTAMKKIGADARRTVLIGDQVFTDVFAGNRAGLTTVMVNPIEAKETPFFGVKRRMEKIVLKDFDRK